MKQHVTRDGRLSSDQLGIWSDDHIKGLEQLVRACHNYGATVLIQIHHAGLTPRNVAEVALPRLNIQMILTDLSGN